MTPSSLTPFKGLKFTQNGPKLTTLTWLIYASILFTIRKVNILIKSIYTCKQVPGSDCFCGEFSSFSQGIFFFKFPAFLKFFCQKRNSFNKKSPKFATWKDAYDFSTFMFCMSLNLAKYSYGWLPHEQHHKIEKGKKNPCTGFVFLFFAILWYWEFDHFSKRLAKLVEFALKKHIPPKISQIVSKKLTNF